MKRQSFTLRKGFFAGWRCWLRHQMAMRERSNLSRQSWARSSLRHSEFLRPHAAERIFNRVLSWMVGARIGLSHYKLLQVPGRKSSGVHSAPVDVLIVGDRKFLVCPRGRSQWVRNAEASGRVWLKKGSKRIQYTIRAVPEADKPELLREYLDQFKLFVQRYFPLPAGSPASAFLPIAGRYPVFEVIVSDDHFLQPATHVRGFGS
jgi:hypothetical protein